MTSRPSLESLPPEVTIAILGETDIGSLQALATTNKRFYELYKDNKTTIHHAIIANTTGPLLHRAVVAYASSHIRWRDAFKPRPDNSQLLPKVHEFGRKYLDHTAKELPIKKEEFTYSMVVKMVKLHKVVEKWTRKYLVWSLSNYNECWNKEGPVAHPSATEITRVQAAFYAIQITRELLPVVIDYDNEDRPWRMLWRYFAPWENQLASEIECFLYRIILDHAPHGKTLHELRRLDFLSRSDEELPRVWFARWGLLGLAKLKKPQKLLNSYHRLTFGRQQYGYRSECCDGTDSIGFSWFPLTTPGNTRWYQLNVDSIQARWPVEESGPRDNWYLSMIEHSSSFVPDKPFSELEQDDPVDDEGSEVSVRSMEGILDELETRHSSWWDRSRLEARREETLPRIEDMRTSGSNLTFDADGFIHDVDFHSETAHWTMHGTLHDNL